MSRLFRAGVRKLHKVISNRINEWDTPAPKSEVEHPYHSLAPIRDANVKDYIEALTWAIENCKKKSIYNIALTGPYGSGKSSILKTFKAQSNKAEDVFLEISLATFKEESQDGDERFQISEPVPDGCGQLAAESVSDVKKNENILRLIELSILQQIFYHEEDSKIPDSRFKKIKSFSKEAMRWTTGRIMLAILTGALLFGLGNIEQSFGFTLPAWASLSIRLIALVGFGIILSIAIFRSIRLFQGIRLSKFRLHEAEIEIDKSISKSILNNHLDEILYFFEVTEYSIVFIEDLDRFRQAEIFTKLRELNLLINKSKKVDQDVIFIYAVRDEIFQDKERTKFFDFIIPVIPVINSSNSKETFSKIILENKYNVSADLVTDLSLFVDDMRLLYNIMNEYHLYHKLLGVELDQTKLLAMIVYKNIYPEDFVKLSNEDGDLFTLMKKRQSYVKDALKEIDEQIYNLTEKIRTAHSHTIKDIVELRLSYLGIYVGHISGFESFFYEDEDYSVLDVAKQNALFDAVIKDEISYKHRINRNGYFAVTTIVTKVNFATIEKLVDPKQSYEERATIVESIKQNAQEDTKHEIQALEKKKLSIRHAKLKDLLSGKIMSLPNDGKQQQLFAILLRNGYIDENYLDYISLFYEGSLTKGDRRFLLAVKNQTGLELDFKLSKIENLIGEMRTVDFLEEYSLNYSLVDFLLENDAYLSHRDSVMEQLSSSSDSRVTFIDGFMENGTNIEHFIKLLVAKWPGMWRHINNNPTYTDKVKRTYLKQILSYADVQDIAKLAPLTEFKSTIASMTDFLTFLVDDDHTKEIIRTLDLKFIDLDLSVGNKEIVDFIYKGNHYEINPTMVEKMITLYGALDRSKFNSANYSALKTSKSPGLLNYVESELDTYITSLYLKIPGNVKEPQDSLSELLNNRNIDDKNRLSIIRQVKTKLNDISSIDDIEIQKALFEENKLAPTWDNLLLMFERNGNEAWAQLVDFMNNSENALALSETKIKSKLLSEEENTVASFTSRLVQEDIITDDTYGILLNSIPHVFNVPELESVPFEKMKLLVQHGSIVFSTENFDELKANYPELQIQLIETSADLFIDTLSEFSLANEDILHVLKSNAFSTKQKSTVLETVDLILISENTTLLTTIVQLQLQDTSLYVPKAIRTEVFKKVTSTTDRVKFFNMYHKCYSRKDIPAIFESFSHPYSDIGVRNKNPLIPLGRENEFLSRNLLSSGFVANSKPDKRGFRIYNFRK